MRRTCQLTPAGACRGWRTRPPRVSWPPPPSGCWARHPGSRRADWGYPPSLRPGRPGGLDVLAADLGLALPLLARAADRDGVAECLALSEHEVQLPLGGLDHDGARLNLGVVAYDLAGIRWGGGADRHQCGGGGEGDDCGAVRH